VTQSEPNANRSPTGRSARTFVVGASVATPSGDAVLVVDPEVGLTGEGEAGVALGAAEGCRVGVGAPEARLHAASVTTAVATRSTERRVRMRVSIFDLRSEEYDAP
jgi:hypothetical protein